MRAIVLSIVFVVIGWNVPREALSQSKKKTAADKTERIEKLDANGDGKVARDEVSETVWAFHGAKDPTVPVEGSRRMIEAMKGAGGSPRYTEYPDVGHGSWNAAYATTEMWDWMFQQRRPRAANK